MRPGIDTKTNTIFLAGAAHGISRQVLNSKWKQKQRNREENQKSGRRIRESGITSRQPESNQRRPFSKKVTEPRCRRQFDSPYAAHENSALKDLPLKRPTSNPTSNRPIAGHLLSRHQLFLRRRLFVTRHQPRFSHRHFLTRRFLVLSRYPIGPRYPSLKRLK